MKSIVDVIGRKEAFQLMEKAVLQATNDNEKLGLPKPVVIDGEVFRQAADGKLQRVEAPDVAKPVAQPKKTISRAA